MEGLFYKTLLKSIAEKEKQLAILIDPDKFVIAEAKSFLKKNSKGNHPSFCRRKYCEKR
jgi:putative glycerol-1-phosphate prenyltransferase